MLTVLLDSNVLLDVPRKPALARGAERRERGQQALENALSRAISRRQVLRADVPPVFLQEEIDLVTNRFY